MEKEKKLKEIEENGFFYHNHYHIIEVSEKKAILCADLTETAMNPYNYAHGGFIFGLGDMTMGLAVSTTGRNGVTLNSNINFLKPGKGKKITAKGEIVKNGKNICYAKATIYDEQENIIATMDANYYYMSEERNEKYDQ